MTARLPKMTLCSHACPLQRCLVGCTKSNYCKRQSSGNRYTVCLFMLLQETVLPSKKKRQHQLFSAGADQKMLKRVVLEGNYKQCILSLNLEDLLSYRQIKDLNKWVQKHKECRCFHAEQRHHWVVWWAWKLCEYHNAFTVGRSQIN